MGFGDSLMLTSIAKRINAMTNQRVVPVTREYLAYWDEVWDGLPYMCRASIEDLRGPQDFFALRNAPSMRHYYTGMDGNRIIWRKWDKAPGEIRLTDEERAWAAERITVLRGPFLVVEPKFKAKGGGGANKDWGIERWREAVSKIVGFKLDVVELGEPSLEAQCGAYRMSTPTFRHACAILERSIGYVGHEGGLHHAAAALGKPAVVVFGGYISPSVTGYANHTNLYVHDERYPLGCGTVTPCEHCRESMSKITVEQVVTAVKEMVR